MTYNQIVNQIKALLQTHPMINDVRFATPAEWLNWDSQPTFPVATYYISSGQLNKGRENVYSVQFWFLDKSGIEGEFETDVVSDQHQIANDIIMAYRQNKDLIIDDQITWNAISEKFEEYLSGVELTINISTTGKFNNCDFPI